MPVPPIKIFPTQIIGTLNLCSVITFDFKILNKNVGIAVKFLNHYLGNSSALGVGIDFGYISKIGNFEIASVVKNIPASGLIWSNGDIEKSIAKLSIGSNYKIKNN